MSQPPTPPRRTAGSPSQAKTGPSPSAGVARGSGATRSANGDVERALVLRDVMDHAVRVQREITQPKPLRKRRGRQIAANLLCVPLLAFCAYSWFARPEFIWGPRPRTATPAEAEATGRFELYLLAQRIENQRAALGGYPADLAVVGDVPAGVTYRLLADTAFELRATANGRELVFRSTENADDFLTSAIPVLRGRAP